LKQIFKSPCQLAPEKAKLEAELTMNFYYLISVIGSRVLNLLAVVLFSYFLSAKEFGQFTIVATNALLLHLIAFSWITSSLWRDASRAQREVVPSVIARSVKYGSVIVAPCLGAAPLAFFWLEPGGRYLIFILLLAPLILLIEMAAVGLNAQRAHQDYSLLGFFRGALALVLGAVFVLLGYGLIGALSGQLLGIALALAALRSVRAMPKGAWGMALNWNEIGPQIRFGLVSALALNLYMFGNSLCRNLIAFNLGEAEAGYFSLAADVFYAPVALFATSLSLSSIPDLYEAHGPQGGSDDLKNGKQQSADFITSNFAVTLPYAVGGAMTAPHVARLLLGSETAQFIAPIAGFAAIQGASFALFSTLTTLALTQGRIKLALLMSLSILGAIALALGFAAHQNSLFAYAQATTAATLLLTTGFLFFCQSIFAIKLPIGEIVKIVISSCMLLSAVWICMMLFSSRWSLFPAVLLGAAAFVGTALLLRSNVVRGLIRLKIN
jgi:O-antigen/teichoic acid export membrane protein